MPATRKTAKIGTTTLNQTFIQDKDEEQRKPMSKRTAPVKTQQVQQSRGRTASKPKLAQKTQSKSVDAAKIASSESDHEPGQHTQSNIAFKQDSFVAFLNKQDDDIVLALAKIAKDSLADDDEIFVQIFFQNKKDKTLFQKPAEVTSTIMAWAVICSVDVAKQTPKTVTITQRTLTQVNKLKGNNFDSVKDKYDELKGSEEDSEPSSSEEEEEQSEPPVLEKRTIVRAKRTIPPKTQPAKRSVSSAKAKPKESIQKDEEEDSDEDIVMIETHKSAAQSAKLNDIKIGVKRKVPSNDSLTQPAGGKKVKRLLDGEEEVVSVATQKKIQKKEAVFKLGKWNPETAVLKKQEEIERQGPSSQPIYNCCTRCNARNLIRAVETKNYTLLRTLVYDLKNIHTLCGKWSDDTKKKPLQIAVAMEDKKMMEIFLDIQGIKATQLSTKEAQQMEFYTSSRVQVRQFLLHKINTGSVSYKAYGAAIRSVAMTRGNRQGNQAFLPKELQAIESPLSIMAELSGLKTSIEMFKSLMLLTNFHMDQLAHHAFNFAQQGNRNGLIWIVEHCMKNEGFGFNKVHLDALKLDRLTEKYHTASITKKANACSNCTPLHFAALNPNKNVIKTLLDQNGDFNVLTSASNWKPIHFAALCSSSGPLEVLIQKGASVYDQTQDKKNALHYAAMSGQADNIRILLKEGSAMLIKVRDRTNFTAMTYACQLGEIEPIKAFIENSDGKIKINTGQGPDRMTPLMWAAAAGKYELAEWLIENKARVTSKDKYKRTALIMAVKNGHTRLASLLLQYGSDWNHMDSSNNTPLHYAAGAGFIECINLLIKHGADVNASNNWKTTPITIAMLLNHSGTVKRLLEEEKVDVNGKDENGRTLLSMVMIDLTDPTCVDFANFLLDKGADPNIVDLEGNATLHLLSSYTSAIQISAYNSEEVNNKLKKEQKEEQAILEKMIDLMILRGANLKLQNSNNQTPFDLALQAENVNLLKKFTQHVKISENPDLLHKFRTKIFDDRYKYILLELINKEIQTQETMNGFNQKGMTPFLAYIEEYSTSKVALSAQIREALKRSYLENKNKAQISITNQDLFVFEKVVERNNPRFGGPRGKKPSSFNNYGNQDNFQQDHDTWLPDDQVLVLVDQYFESLINKPFISLLTLLVSKGANPHQKVDKLSFYRELDEHKRRLAQIGDAREGISMINSTKNTAETVKTRKEVLAEQKIEKKSKVNNKHDKQKEKEQKKKIDSQLKEFYAKKGYQAQFQKSKDGKLIEIEYDKEVGLQNAVHLCMLSETSDALFKYLVEELKVAVDEIDFQSRNPFLIFTQKHPSLQKVADPLQKLLDLNVRFDLANQDGRTPFLIYYEHQNYFMAYKLLQHGAYVKQIDHAGLYALKYALIRRDNEQIESLIAKGADINQIDNQGRNLLHHAVNMSSATADATFETEQLLIDHGININLRDCRGRVPLHYAFVKLKGWNNFSQIDPIETVSSLCGQKGLDIEVADKWLKTPLHYAAQRGAAICTLYILQRGSNIEAKDIYGNTALGICLLKKHFNYGIILIQKQADVRAKVHEEFPNRLAKRWLDEEKEAKKQQRQINGDVDMESSEEEAKTGRDLFNKKVNIHNPMINVAYGSEDDSQEYSDEEEDEEERNEKFEANVFNNQNAFGMTVFGQQKQQPHTGLFGQQPSQPQQSSSIEKETEPKSTFRVAIQNQQQGLAYLVLDNKYDYMHAMQDALDEKKFQLMLTLLSKTADDKIVRQKNDKNQNLMHILAQNSNGGQFTHLKRIYDILKVRGVQCLEKDSLNNNALHYAVKSNCFDLCEILIKEGINVNQINNMGHSPLSLLLEGEKASSTVLKPDQPQPKHLFTLLAQNSADMNACYPESTFGENYKCSILINFVRQTGTRQDVKLLLSNLKCLIDYGAQFNTFDSLGRDIMIHAVMLNQTPLVSFIIANLLKGLKINHQDHEGKTAIHYVVCPVLYGSYENTEILNLLYASGQGYKLEIADKSGQQPLDYSIEHTSGKMATELQKLLKVNISKRKVKNFVETQIPEEQWPVSRFNFDDDSHRFLQEAEEKRAMQIQDEKAYVPLDRVVFGEKQYKVYFDEDGRPWDAYLAKVDLKNGLYGDYVFYKMQLLHDTNRDLFIVLTRYGRIGEEGMNQRSPFPNAEDAKKEFATIFKQKSSNEWQTALTNFVKQPKKYNLVHVHYSNIKHEDYLSPFDYENCFKATQLEKHVKQMIEEISNVTMYQRAIQSVGVNQDLMPVSALRKEILVQAKDKLVEIKILIEKFEKIRQQGLKADFEEAQRIQDELADLSSQYYELVPMNENKDQLTRPINQLRQLQDKFQQLDTLTQVEFSSRILIGALYKQIEVNPIDYVYESLNTHINLLQPGSGEHDLLFKYIQNSYESGHKFQQLRIFKLQRKGEFEKYNQFKHLDNRMLLFHGSAMTNMLGILAQGLRIAPKEAPTTGYMFGKGIYFADAFKKSLSYTQGLETRLMFLCEVALGNKLKLYDSHYVEQLPTKYHSVMGCGSNGPQQERQTLITPDGYQVPIGAHVQYEQPDEKDITKSWSELGVDPNTKNQANVFGGGIFGATRRAQPAGYPVNRWVLQQNEFIVYNTDQVKIRYIIQFQL